MITNYILTESTDLFSEGFLVDHFTSMALEEKNTKCKDSRVKIPSF